MNIFDAHCDTLLKALDDHETLWQNTKSVSFEQMSAFERSCQIFAVWLDDNRLKAPFLNSFEAIHFLYDQLEDNQHIVQLVLDSKDLSLSAANKKISVLLSLEGGEALENDIENLYAFYFLGVRAITLTWNRRNALGDGASVRNPGGLTAFGKYVIIEMNRLGMAVDVSHLSEQGFWDVVETSSKPFMASHSNSRALCDHPRNLTNSQLRALGEKNGVIGINFYPPFLKKSLLPTASMDDILLHVDHIFHTAGEYSVAFGSDFDGIEQISEDIQNFSGYMQLGEILAKKYGYRIADNFLYANLANFFTEVL